MDITAGEGATHGSSRDNAFQITITLEGLIVLVLVLLSVAFRVLALDAPHISHYEARPALAAYRDVFPDAAGEAITPESPVLYWVQRLGLSLLGGNEFATRIGTALAGVLAGLTPLLFRGLLGRGRALIFSVLLTGSAVLLVASRMSGPMVWAVLFAAFALWGVWRFLEAREVERRAKSYAVTATAAYGGLLFLCGPGGIVFGFVLAIAAVITVFLTALAAPDDYDMPGNEYIAAVREMFSGWPVFAGIVAAGGLVLVVSTGFMLRPEGLSAVAVSLESFLHGFLHRAPDSLLVFPLSMSLFFDIWLWLLAGLAVVLLVRRNAMGVVDRFLGVWLLVALAISIVYPGGRADYALMIIVPLAALGSYLLTDAVDPDAPTDIWVDGLMEEGAGAAIVRAKVICAVVAVALLFVLSIHLQEIVRGFLYVPGGSLSGLIERLGENGGPMADTANSLVWFILTILFMVVTFFLGASVWGNQITARGAVLGVAAFGLIASLGAGWTAAVVGADDPAEFWNIRATVDDAGTLRQIMVDLAARETSGEPLLDVAAQVPDDGVLAWQLRDFVNLTFIDDPDQARGEPVAILPDTLSEPGLEGTYVGTRIVAEKVWPPGSMEGFDFLMWWVVRETRYLPGDAGGVVLWVRQDVYDAGALPGGTSGAG